MIEFQITFKNSLNNNVLKILNFKNINEIYYVTLEKLIDLESIRNKIEDFTKGFYTIEMDLKNYILILHDDETKGKYRPSKLFKKYLKNYENN
jgi:hypothetical protein